MTLIHFNVLKIAIQSDLKFEDQQVVLSNFSTKFARNKNCVMVYQQWVNKLK